MLIYLWRHGQAEKDSLTGKDDDRVLSPEGRNEIIEVADRLFGNEGTKKPEKIFTSPLARARESAEMIQGYLACAGGLETLPELRSGTGTDALIAAVRKSAGSLSSFVLVGHMPDLGQLADRFLGHPDQRISLRPAGTLRIELAGLQEPFGGKLLLALNPEEILE